jgi:hypothetical protein
MNNVYKVKSAGNSYVIVNGLDGSTVPDSLCHNYPTARAIVKSMNKRLVPTWAHDVDAYLLSNPKRIGCNY